MNFAEGFKTPMGGPVEDQEGLNAIKQEGIKKARQDAKNKDIKILTDNLNSGAGPMKTKGFGSNFSLIDQSGNVDWKGAAGINKSGGDKILGPSTTQNQAATKDVMSKNKSTDVSNASTSINKNLTPYIAMGDKKTNPADFPSYEHDPTTNMYIRKDVANKPTKVSTLDAKPISTNVKPSTLKTLPVNPAENVTQGYGATDKRLSAGGSRRSSNSNVSKPSGYTGSAKSMRDLNKEYRSGSITAEQWKSGKSQIKSSNKKADSSFKSYKKEYKAKKNKPAGIAGYGKVKNARQYAKAMMKKNK